MIHAILEHEGASLEDLEEVRREKRARRGGFEDRVVLERVEDDGTEQREAGSSDATGSSGTGPQ